MIDERFYALTPPTKLGELLSGLDIGEIAADHASTLIAGVSDLAQSQVGDIAFLGSKKNKADLDTAGATACLVPKGCAELLADLDIIAIETAFPRTHFGRVMDAMARPKSIFDAGVPSISPDATVHPSAVIGAGATISAGVQVYPYAVIGPGVVVGEGTVIESHTQIECAIIGRDCHIKSNATVGTRGFGVDGDELGLFDLPHLGRAILGDRVSIGCQSAIDRGFLGDTVIGNDVKIDNLVQVAHNVTIGDGSMLAGHVGLSGSCSVGKNVLMGGSVGLADHITVGDGAKIAARAGVMHDIPAGEMWSGIPAMPFRDHMRLISATRKLIKK